MAANIHFNIPAYCDIYKPLLVEEIYYLASPTNLHHGMCSVIGKITFKDDRYLLQNVKLSSMDKAYQLPTGAINVLIIPLQEAYPPLPIDQFVEIFGETILWARDQNAIRISTGDCQERSLPITSAFLVRQLRQAQIELEAARGLPAREPTGMNDKSMNSTIKLALRKRIDDMRKKYEPAIYLDSFKIIDEADEVITCNLELRAVQIKKQKQTELRNRWKS